MKKMFATILALLYLGSSIGATINIHYCMGKVFKVDMARTDDCSQCGMKNTGKGCCKSEVKFVKVSDSHQPAASEVHFATPVAVLHQQPAVPAVTLQTVPLVTTHNNSPPFPSSGSLCILNCVFRL